MTPSTNSAHAASMSFSPRRRTLAFIVVAIAFVMDLLDVTIVHVAMPTIRASLGSGAAALQWAVAGYALAFALVVVTGGRLGDVFGYRRMFLIGVAAFTATSMLCGLAFTPWQLVGARALQGASAALMVPQVMALMQVMYAPAERLRVFSIFGLLGGAASALGPVAGGLLIEHNIAGLGWRSVFLLNGPLGLFALVAGARLLPRGASAQPKALDVRGTLLVALTLLALVLPLIQGPEGGWPAWSVLSLVAVPPLAWATWWAWTSRQLHDGSALVNPALLHLPSVRRGLLASMGLRGIVPAYLLAMTFVVQGGLGASPGDMALLCMPIAAGATVSVAFLARRAVGRLGPRSVALGAALQGLALGMAWAVAHQLLDAPRASALDPRLLGAHALLGLGIGLIGPPLTTFTLKDVPIPEAGSAAGVNSAVQQIATALAFAVVGGLMFLGQVQVQEAVSLQAGMARAMPALLVLLVIGAGCMPRSRGREDPVRQ